MEEAEPNIVEKLGIRVVPESELGADWHEITVPVHLGDPHLASMWSTLKNCGAVGTLGKDGRITIWRQMPRLVYIGKGKGSRVYRASN
jgi:hypothetical protein